MAVILSVIAGPNVGTVFNFQKHDTFILGRSRGCHLRLPEDSYISRNHFLIEVHPPVCRILDLGSRNGTLVGRRRIHEPTNLQDGDEISVGKTVLKVTITENDDPESVFLEVQLAQMEADWRGGNRHPAERYINQIPPEFDEEMIALEIIQREYDLRKQGKESPRQSDFIKRFPQYAALLKLSLPKDDTTDDIPKRPNLFPEAPGFEVLARVGAGSMGTVYRARRLSDQTEVALKFLNSSAVPNNHALRRFYREGRILSRLTHPNIVQYHDLSQANNQPFLIMEWVDGVDLATKVRKQGPLKLEVALRYLIDALQGIHYAHERGYVHRDLKPSNLIVGNTPTGEIVKIADFGLARSFDEEQSQLTLTGVTAGTPAFMAPEQIHDFRNVRPISDQHSLAATLFYMLTGTPPFSASSSGMLYAKILDETRPNVHEFRQDIPESFSPILNRAMARDPAERYENCEVFRQVLLKYLTEKVI